MQYFELGIPVLQCTDDVVALRQSVRVIYPLFCEETALIDWPLIVNVKEGVDLSSSSYHHHHHHHHLLIYLDDIKLISSLHDQFWL